MKKLRLILCLLLTLSLCGCASTQQSDVTATLPPAKVSYEAPADDEGMQYTTQAALFLPSIDDQRLLCRYVSVTLRHDTHPAQAIVQALLNYAGDEMVHSIGNGTQLTLYGQNPVEVAGGVCTVDLTSSALILDDEALYTACLAISTTLCELSDIQQVNVLVADQAISMDISGNLPMGALRGHSGEDLTLLWEQMEARRTPLGGDASTVPVTAMATLYFPLADGSGVIPEVRTLTFPGQTPQQLAAVLMTALSDGAQYISGTASMPVLDDLMTTSPQVSDMMEGGRLVTLNFVDDLENQLAAYDIPLNCFVASVTDTLMTFVPSVTAVNIQVGSELLTQATSLNGETVVFNDGVIRRTAFEDFLMDQVTIYLAKGDKLTAVTRTLPAGEASSPRVLLQELMQGTTAEERAAGISNVLPAGLTNADVLGLSLEDDTLVINLSAHAAETIRQAGSDSEQLTCYSIVNTMCAAKGVRRVIFFFDGASAEQLGGSLYWSGEFYDCPGLIE